MIQFIDFSEKVFLITGAGSGIGQEVARTCYAMGAKLLLLDKNESGLAGTTVDMVTNRYVSRVIDLTEYEQIEPAVHEAAAALGLFSGFCHCAGIEYTLPIKLMTPQHYLDLFSINTISGFEIARVLSKKKYCSISGASFIYIASIMGQVGRPGLIGYSASKGALIAGARSMALELAAKGIRVNCVSPGTVKTELINNMLKNLEPEQREKRLGDFPLGLGTPEDVANMVVFLLSEKSRWVTGTNITIDGGYTAK